MHADKNSNFSTLGLMILKEIRLEKGVHQGIIANYIGKSPSAWARIENGQSSLTFDIFISTCAALQTHPSHVISLVDKLLPLFTSANFYFQAGTLSAEDEDEDDLMGLVSSYFNSKGYEALKFRPMEKVTIESLGQPFGFKDIPTIVRYCCEQEFKEWIDNGAEGRSPEIPRRRRWT